MIATKWFFLLVVTIITGSLSIVSTRRPAILSRSTTIVVPNGSVVYQMAKVMIRWRKLDDDDKNDDDCDEIDRRDDDDDNKNNDDDDDNKDNDDDDSDRNEDIGPNVNGNHHHHHRYYDNDGGSNNDNNDYGSNDTNGDHYVETGTSAGTNDHTDDCDPMTFDLYLTEKPAHGTMTLYVAPSKICDRTIVDTMDFFYYPHRGEVRRIEDVRFLKSHF